MIILASFESGPALARDLLREAEDIVVNIGFSGAAGGGGIAIGAMSVNYVDRVKKNSGLTVERV